VRSKRGKNECFDDGSVKKGKDSSFPGKSNNRQEGKGREKERRKKKEISHKIVRLQKSGLRLKKMKTTLMTGVGYFGGRGESQEKGE